ncbi:MAG: hypothetical protein IPL65_09485 [Lewinellaceae bacterium]|nr:hypothetical protein [Lewinellaceae bacterium]
MRLKFGIRKRAKADLTLDVHSSNINSVAFSPDGKRLATGSFDNTAKIWDLTPRKRFEYRRLNLAGLSLTQLSNTVSTTSSIYS